GQDRPRRDACDVRQGREVHEREAARRRELCDRVRVVAAWGGVELAELAGDRVAVLVEADRRVTRGQERHVGLEVPVALLQALVDKRDPLLITEFSKPSA